MDQTIQETGTQAEEEIEDVNALGSQSEHETEETVQPDASGEMPEQTETDAQTHKEEATEEEELEDEGELVIEIEGGTPDPEEQEKKEAPEWVKRTRKENRELNKKLKQREKELEELQAKINPEPEIPNMPSLYDEGINGDEKVFADKIRERDKVIAQIEARKDAQKKQQEEEQAAVQKRLDTYTERKAQIASRVPDYSEHVKEAEESLSEMQTQAIAYYFQDKAAELMYAIGKNPDTLEKLSSMKDPMEMLLAAKDIQSSMKITKRKPAHKPETPVEGQIALSGSDATLAKLERQHREGKIPRTDVIAYKLKHGITSK